MPNHHNPPGYHHFQRQQTLTHSVTFEPLPPHQGSPDLPRYTHPSSTSPYASYQTNERTPLKAIDYPGLSRRTGDCVSFLYLTLLLAVFFVPLLFFLGTTTFSEKMPYWGPLELTSTRCLTYNTREYAARLHDVPMNTWLKTCMSMPQMIHNQNVSSPTRCEYHDGSVKAYWIIDFDEASCRPHWDRYWVKACSAGIRTWEGQLYSFKGEDDQFEMCQSTPAPLPSGETREKADYCDDRRGWNKQDGMVGGWRVQDDGCL